MCLVVNRVYSLWGLLWLIWLSAATTLLLLLFRFLRALSLHREYLIIRLLMLIQIRLNSLQIRLHRLMHSDITLVSMSHVRLPLKQTWRPIASLLLDQWGIFFKFLIWNVKSVLASMEPRQIMLVHNLTYFFICDVDLFCGSNDQFEIGQKSISTGLSFILVFHLFEEIIYFAEV